MALFICNNCSYGSASWLGKCPDCGEFNTLKEQLSYAKATEGKEKTKKLSLIPFAKIRSQVKNRIKTGIFEFDRVLGGGFIPGEVVLLTGEPGVGKSTLLLESLSKLTTIYISGEESAEQVKGRAERLKISLDNFLFSDTLQVEGIIQGLESVENKIDVVVIDSIQTVYSNTIDATAGSISQMKESAKKLIIEIKKQGLAMILVGHITKGGEIAGPKSLEHFVDCVLNLEGEKVSNFRLLRAAKNRFGPTDEIGLFEMKQTGLTQITNPLVFVESEKEKNAVGKAVVGSPEGKRTLFFEIQTLAVPTVLAVPRRVVKGLDYNKVQLLLAVVRKYLHHPLDTFDIYVNVIGGVSIQSTASDLGFIASLLSSLKNKEIPKKTLFVGEVGLLGEVRKVYGQEKIISEARRLGFVKFFSSLNLSSIKEFKNLL